MGRSLSLTMEWGQHGAEAVLLLSTGQLPHHLGRPATPHCFGVGPRGFSRPGEAQGSGQSQVHPAWIEQYPSQRHSH